MVRFCNFLNFFQLDSGLVFFFFFFFFFFCFSISSFVFSYKLFESRRNPRGSESFILITLLGIHSEARSVIGTFKLLAYTSVSLS